MIPTRDEPFKIYFWEKDTRRYVDGMLPYSSRMEGLTILSKHQPEPEWYPRLGELKKHLEVNDLPPVPGMQRKWSAPAHMEGV